MRLEIKNYRLIDLTARIINLILDIGFFLNRFRNFFKVTGVTIINILLGRFVIFNWSVTPRNEGIVWFIVGLLTYIYLGHTAMKIQKRSLINLFWLATGLIIAELLILFLIPIFSSYQYQALSQAIFSWPALMGALILAMAWAIEFAHPGGRRESPPIPSKKMSTSNWLIYQLLPIIGLVLFVFGAGVLIFSLSLRPETGVIKEGIKIGGIMITALSLLPLSLILILWAYSLFKTIGCEIFLENEPLDMSNESDHSGVYYNANFPNQIPAQLRELPELMEFMNSFFGPKPEK